MGEEMCACPRDKVIRDLYWGLDFRREGVLMCSCVRVQGRERLVCVWGGGWLQIKREVSIFERLKRN